MNFAFVALVILCLIIIWFLIFIPLGRLFNWFYNRTKDKIQKENNINEKEKKDNE